MATTIVQHEPTINLFAKHGLVGELHHQQAHGVQEPPVRAISIAQPINLSAVALAYLDSVDVVADMYLVERMCCELAQIERITGDAEFGDSEQRYAYLVASGEEIGFADMPASLLPC